MKRAYLTVHFAHENGKSEARARNRCKNNSERAAQNMEGRHRWVSSISGKKGPKQGPTSAQVPTTEPPRNATPPPQASSSPRQTYSNKWELEQTTSNYTALLYCSSGKTSSLATTYYI